MLKIAVILTDGTFQIVSADELNMLLQKKTVQSFLRSDGWVRVGFDALREAGGCQQYAGNDRRKQAPLKRSRCSYCEKDFFAVDRGSIYSVIVEDCGRSLQIIEGELIHGAYHFCSDICMFRREQGTVCIDRLAPELLLRGAG
jgi:hypothetical protein